MTPSNLILMNRKAPALHMLGGERGKRKFLTITSVSSYITLNK